MNSLISVIVPVYCIEQYIEQCIKSILNQTYGNIELLLIDNNSTDNSLQICKKYEREDSRVIVLHEEKQGVSNVRNLGLEKAKGQYICFVDGDDWLDSEACEISLKTMINNDADLVMWGYTREFGSRSAEKRIYDTDVTFDYDQVQKQLRRRLIGLYGEELQWPEKADSLSTVWGKLYKSDYIKGISFIDLNYIGTNEDGLFNIDYLKKVKRSVYLNETWYHYRKGTGDSITSRYDNTRIVKWLNMIDEVGKRVDIDNQVECEAFQNRICLSIIGQTLNINRSTLCFSEKVRETEKILSLDCYQKAFEQLKLKYFKSHWKFFFFLCKTNQAALLTLVSNAMLHLKRYIG